MDMSPMAACRWGPPLVPLGYLAITWLLPLALGLVAAFTETRRPHVSAIAILPFGFGSVAASVGAVNLAVSMAGMDRQGYAYGKGDLLELLGYVYPGAFVTAVLVLVIAVRSLRNRGRWLPTEAFGTRTIALAAAGSLVAAMVVLFTPRAFALADAWLVEIEWLLKGLTTSALLLWLAVGYLAMQSPGAPNNALQRTRFARR